MTDTRFGIQFVVTRDGEPITDVITVENAPVSLHIAHDQREVWTNQAKVLGAQVQSAVMNVDALADVVPDTRLIGLQVPPEGVFKRKVGVPILKRINHVMLAVVKRLNEYNAKRGSHVD